MRMTLKESQQSQPIRPHLNNVYCSHARLTQLATLLLTREAMDGKEVAFVLLSRQVMSRNPEQ